MASKTLQDLPVKALPKMAKAATSSQLRSGFETHQKETEGHVERLEAVCKPGGETCDAMEGIISEGQEMINFKAEDEIRDTGLIVAAQKAEHYEIALYGGLCALSKQLGQEGIASTLSQTLQEEKRTDQKLTQLAESSVNRKAASLTPAMS
jgi:ferritin-like metal-binding protein YciE